MKRLNRDFRVRWIGLLSVGVLLGPLPLIAKAEGQDGFPARLSAGTVGPVAGRYENSPLPRALDEQEMGIVVAQVASRDGMMAGSAARFLANARLNPVAARLKPILERFEDEAEHPTKIETAWPCSLSGPAVVRTQFLLALDHLEKAETVEALQNEREADVSPVVRLWLGVALGYIGEKSVVGEIKAALDTEKDPSTRAVLLGAYARSAKAEAVPTLERFVHDQTVTATACLGPCYGLQMVARSELARLRNAEVGNRNAETGHGEGGIEK